MKQVATLHHRSYSTRTAMFAVITDENQQVLAQCQHSHSNRDLAQKCGEKLLAELEQQDQ